MMLYYFIYWTSQKSKKIDLKKFIDKLELKSNLFEEELR